MCLTKLSSWTYDLVTVKLMGASRLRVTLPCDNMAGPLFLTNVYNLNGLCASMGNCVRRRSTSDEVLESLGIWKGSSESFIMRCICSCLLHSERMLCGTLLLYCHCHHHNISWKESITIHPSWSRDLNHVIAPCCWRVTNSVPLTATCVWELFQLCRWLGIFRTDLIISDMILQRNSEHSPLCSLLCKIYMERNYFCIIETN